jgi:hypothetical protein
LIALRHALCNLKMIFCLHILALDNYEKGIRLTKTAEETSNLETDSDKDEKRKRKQICRFGSDDSEGTSDDLILVPLCQSSLTSFAM